MYCSNINRSKILISPVFWFMIKSLHNNNSMYNFLSSCTTSITVSLGVSWIENINPSYPTCPMCCIYFRLPFTLSATMTVASHSCSCIIRDIIASVLNIEQCPINFCGVILINANKRQNFVMKSDSSWKLAQLIICYLWIVNLMKDQVSNPIIFTKVVQR